MYILKYEIYDTNISWNDYNILEQYKRSNTQRVELCAVMAKFSASEPSGREPVACGAFLQGTSFPPIPSQLLIARTHCDCPRHCPV